MRGPSVTMEVPPRRNIGPRRRWYSGGIPITSDFNHQLVVGGGREARELAAPLLSAQGKQDDCAGLWRRTPSQSTTLSVVWVE